MPVDLSHFCLVGERPTCKVGSVDVIKVAEQRVTAAAYLGSELVIVESILVREFGSIHSFSFFISWSWSRLGLVVCKTLNRCPSALHGLHRFQIQ